MDQTVFQELKVQVRGPVLTQGDAGYDEARMIWNGMIDRRPAAIVRCLGVVDVIQSIAFARKHSIRISIKGGGHNIAGLAVCDGGLMLDMSLMRGVWVDQAHSIAHAQAGCLLGDVDRETQLYGLAGVLGFVSNTGIAGLTLGGGFGYLTRKYGWTSDNVRSMELVTAEGKVVRASEKENPDLFWGLRGGGGNFGVVTNFEYALYPVGPEIISGAMAWPAERATEILKVYQTLANNASPEFTCVAVMRIAPPAPWLAKEIHGKPIILIVVCHTGSLENAQAEVAPLKAIGSPVGDILQKRSYVSQQCLLDATQPKGRRYYWKSEYLPGLNANIFPQFMKHASLVRSPHSAVILFPVGGALNRIPADHSSVGNRDAAFVLNITAAWDNPPDDQANIQWARDAWQEMRAFSTGGTYINFLTEEEVGDRIVSAYRDNYQRLIDVKKKWDPDNVFQMNKNIRTTQ